MEYAIMAPGHGEPDSGSKSVGAAKDEVPPELAALFERARGKLIARLKVLHDALGELERDALTIETLEAAKREAHKLAGSLGTYGLASGSVKAREIEVKLEEGAPAQIESSWLRARVAHIERLLHQAKTGEPQQETGPQRPPRETKPFSAPTTSGPAARTAMAPGTAVAPKGDGEKHGPSVSKATESALDRLVDQWLQGLTLVEEVAAKMVRDAGRSAGRRALQEKEAEQQNDALQAARRSLKEAIRGMESVGLDAAVALAREIQGLLPSRLDPGRPPKRLPRLAELLFRLQESLGRLRDPREAGESTVWVVSPDVDWAEHMAAALEATGFDTKIATGTDAFDDVSSRSTPKPGVVLDARAVDPETLQGLKGTLGQLPTVLALRSPGLGDRVAAGRAGVDRVVERSQPPHQLAATFANLEQQRRLATGRILVVDDDREILAMVQATLQHAGFEVIAVEGPHGFWDALEANSPDLIVTDLDMPETDGADLCMALRTDPRWENLPVIFLSAQEDAGRLRQVFDSGADDFVPKPVDPATLITRVRARLRRHQQRIVTGHLDPVTRLPMGMSLQENAERMIASVKNGRPVTVAVVALNDDRRLRTQMGGPALERQQYGLARRLVALSNTGALVGRLELDRFLVAFSGLDRYDARTQIEEALVAFHEGQEDDNGDAAAVTACAGLAQSGLHGNTLAGLVSAAEDARGKAERQGVCVLVSGGKAGVTMEHLDVLVVDDDETIGTLLQDALGQKGWRVRWERDSQQALKRLSGEQADLRARVILLDVNMPGMDGLTVLRLLSERGVVPPARVVMLTVRAREDEVVRALELGAVDHVAKPFSVPVLVSRIERAVGD